MSLSSGYTYVASPYTHDNPLIREQRYDQVLEYCYTLMTANVWCYSPIVHCHEMAKRFVLPTNYEYWQAYNDAMLNRSFGLHVLMLEGWENSRGVKYEVDFWMHKYSHRDWLNGVIYVPWSKNIEKISSKPISYSNNFIGGSNNCIFP